MFCSAGMLQVAARSGKKRLENNENTGKNEKSQVSLALSSGGGGN